MTLRPREEEVNIGSRINIRWGCRGVELEWNLTGKPVSRAGSEVRKKHVRTVHDKQAKGCAASPHEASSKTDTTG